MDINNFINCDGLVKDEIVRTLDWFKINKRFYSFEDGNGIVLIKWKDEYSCLFTYGKKSEITLYKAGKKSYHHKYSTVETPKLLSACLELFSIQEKFKHTDNYEFADW